MFFIVISAFWNTRRQNIDISLFKIYDVDIIALSGVKLSYICACVLYMYDCLYLRQDSRTADLEYLICGIEVPSSPLNALVQLMAYRLIGTQPLSEQLLFVWHSFILEISLYSKDVTRLWTMWLDMFCLGHNLQEQPWFPSPSLDT